MITMTSFKFKKEQLIFKCQQSEFDDINVVVQL